jgi:hypothetical protein
MVLPAEHHENLIFVPQFELGTILLVENMMPCYSMVCVSQEMMMKIILLIIKTIAIKLQQGQKINKYK